VSARPGPPPSGRFGNQPSRPLISRDCHRGTKSRNQQTSSFISEILTQRGPWVSVSAELTLSLRAVDGGNLPLLLITRNTILEKYCSQRGKSCRLQAELINLLHCASQCSMLAVFGTWGSGTLVSINVSTKPHCTSRRTWNSAELLDQSAKWRKRCNRKRATSKTIANEVVYWWFGRTYCLHLQGRRAVFLEHEVRKLLMYREFDLKPNPEVQQA